MHLGGAILIVAALVAAEAAPTLAPRSGLVDVFLVGLGSLLVILAAAAISGLVAAQIRSNPASLRESLRGYSRLRRLHTSLWFAVSAVGVLVMQWPQWVVRELPTPFVLVDELLVLLPVVMPMFFSYAAFFEVDRAAAGVLGSRSANRLDGRWSYAWWFLRHEFGLVVVPLSILILVRDVAEAVGPASGGAGPVAGLSVLVLLTGFPLLMKVIWPCSPLADAELRSAITVECGSVGQRVPQLLEWNSGGRVVNAVVTGTLPRTHCVFLSDALLKHFTHAEILAVLRHELAHARRHHILLRVVALAVPLVLCHVCGVPRVAEDAYQRLVRANFAAGEWGVLAATAAGLVGYAWWVFGGFSRMLEIEADLLSCGDGHVEPDRAGSAEAALTKLGCVYGLDRQSWLHPTLRTRLRILRAASRRARFAGALLNRARWWKISMVAALALAIAAAALQSG